MYTVEWFEPALNRLAAIWLQSTSADRERITVASNEIDLLLQSNPHGTGESRRQGRRIAFVLPLAILFRVQPDDQTVTILQVRFIRGSSP